MGFHANRKSRSMRPGYLSSLSKRCTATPLKLNRLTKQSIALDNELHGHGIQAQSGKAPMTQTLTPRRQSPKPQTSPPTSNSVGVAEAEAWLKRQMAEEENKKSRTVFVPSLQVPQTPNSNGVYRQRERETIRPQTPISQPAQGSNCGHKAGEVLETWASSFSQSPQQRSAGKAHSRAQANLSSCGEALSQYLAKDPQSKRGLQEQREYNLIKAKADRGVALSEAERNRLKQITKNNTRRLLTLSLKEELGTEEPPSTENAEVSAGRDEEKDNEINAKPISKAKETGLLADCAKQAPDQAAKRTTGQVTHEIASPEVPTPPEAADEDVTSEYTEDSDVDMADADDADDNQELDSEEPQCYWEYSVYRTDANAIEGSMDPVCLSTYLSNQRAEERVRDEINETVHNSTADCTKLEVRTVFEDGRFQGQTAEFATGRTVDVQIIKELIEDPPKVKKTQSSRRKLEILPAKVYAIMERISETAAQECEFELVMAPSPSSNEESPLDSTSPGLPQPVWKECFVVKEHANRQANMRMLEHLTSHLPDEQKFDVAITGGLDTESRHHLRELEDGDRLYNRTMALPRTGAHGRKLDVTVRVIELLLRGPRN